MLPEKPVIFPIDGQMSLSCVLDSFSRLFFGGAIVRNMVGAVKLNDALHISPPGGLCVAREILRVAKDSGLPIDLFLDFKLADVSASNGNICKHYNELNPSIVTVSAVVACKSLIAIREVFPTACIALVSALTDVPLDEFRARYGMMPVEYIEKQLNFYEERLGADNPIGAYVCSPLEVAKLKTVFGTRYQAIVPGVRSTFMAKDHQERVTGPYQAILDGADYLVMGAQLSKGNPQAGISPAESQRRTYWEIYTARMALNC